MSSTQQLNELYTVIYQSHNPALIIISESPNGNTIYHVYSDGEITEQKGGVAYGRRAERTLRIGIYKANYSDLFPLKREGSFNQTFGYAIVTQADAHKIADLIQIQYNSEPIQNYSTEK